MKKNKYAFSRQTVAYYFDAPFSYLKELVDPAHSVIVTDRNIYDLHKKKFSGWKTIVLPPGEAFKTQATVDSVIGQLIEMNADRKSFLVGVGGGVVTDITGYAASVYMRGIRFGFAPTSLLAMVDASIGGKNGVDVGLYKNLVGAINQPDFLLFDPSLLKTLPEDEWVNGFAEIVKHACIKDARLFKELERHNVRAYSKNKEALSALIRRNAIIKTKVVLADEFESGVRKLLNFGHTWGHAIENKYGLAHGQAVALGMVVACRLSEKLCGFSQTGRVIGLLEQYGLPTAGDFDKKATFDALKMDKKKVKTSMNYVLLSDIGKSLTKSIPMDELEKLIDSL